MYKEEEEEEEGKIIPIIFLFIIIIIDNYKLLREISLYIFFCFSSFLLSAESIK